MTTNLLCTIYLFGEHKGNGPPVGSYIKCLSNQHKIQTRIKGASCRCYFCRLPLQPSNQHSMKMMKRKHIKHLPNFTLQTCHNTSDMPPHLHFKHAYTHSTGIHSAHTPTCMCTSPPPPHTHTHTLHVQTYSHTLTISSNHI